MAASVVGEFIANPDEFQFDLLDSPVVQQLARHPKHAPLHKLLITLISGDVKVRPVTIMQANE